MSYCYIIPLIYNTFGVPILHWYSDKQISTLYMQRLYNL